MPLLGDVSPITIGLSIGVSIATSWVGTLINFQRQRNRARRTYGLAILSEIKTIQRALRLYAAQLRPELAPLDRLPRMPITTSDLNVFGFNAGNIGLFSVRTAVEVIDFYSRVRMLIYQAKEIEDARASAAAETCVPPLWSEHLASLVAVRAQGRAAAALLREELPAMLEEQLRWLRRRARVAVLMTIRRRLAVRVAPAPVTAASSPTPHPHRTHW